MHEIFFLIRIVFSGKHLYDYLFFIYENGFFVKFDWCLFNTNQIINALFYTNKSRLLQYFNRTFLYCIRIKYDCIDIDSWTD